MRLRCASLINDVNNVGRLVGVKRRSPSEILGASVGVCPNLNFRLSLLLRIEVYSVDGHFGILDFVGILQTKQDSLSFQMWYEALPGLVIIGSCIAVTGLGLKVVDRLFQEGKVLKHK